MSVSAQNPVYVVPIDFGTPGSNRFSHKVLTSDMGSQNCAITYLRTPPSGESDADLHVHDVDQIFYLIAGEMTVDINGQRSVAKPGDVVFFPAGIAHRNWNDIETEHLGIAAPAPAPGKPFSQAATLSSSLQSELPNYVFSFDFGTLGSSDKFSYRAIGPDKGSQHSAMTFLRTPKTPRSADDRHFHDVDQIFYLLSGEMFIEIDGEEFTVSSGSIVLFPTGVPHCNWNDGVTEHIAIWAPAPDPSTTYTHPVLS